ncbi:MAG: hypothetical protein ABR976_01990 [Terracidiphilus sp.]
MYKNVDDAFPLYIQGWQGNVSGSARGSAIPDVGNLEAKLNATYATKIQGLLFAIDELSQTVVINFRAIYLAFQTDPCSNGDFFVRQVAKLVSEQQQISRWRIQVGGLIELARNRPDETERILTIFKEIAGGVGGAPAVEAIRLEIVEAREIAGRWSDKS